MKLSEAIKLGAMLKPQGIGENSIHATSPATCAWGAAIEAAAVPARIARIEEIAGQAPARGTNGGATHSTVYAIPREWQRIAGTRVVCPACLMADGVYRIIPHLNDDHRWTREQIADWIATMETEEAAPAEVVTSGSVPVLP